MLTDINLDALLENIRSVFVNEEEYGLDKHVWEYKQNESMLGDSVVFTMAEKTSPPTFYYVISPYDLESGKAPQYALVFKDGKLLLSTDYTEYANMRTGAMDTLVLQTLGINDLKDKAVLMFGKGATATWSQKFLKHVYGKELSITVVDSRTPKDSYQIQNFDVIICHTNTKDYLLSADDRSKIKKGAVITNFISSQPNTELEPSFFSEKANIIVDWQSNLQRMPEITTKTNVITLRELFAKEKSIDNSMDYTIFRTVGTPLQNLAVLQTLIG